ncbi:hypothetical protein M3Y99_00680100 [Aphelenchoides fujianensis]|nr:hypothetical protein M3Y99_00680100 [Aphelenchoides fujianensis]
MSFADKVVIVTGSSSGIGQDCAVLFATEGAAVTIHGQNEERLKETLAQLKQSGVSIDKKILQVVGPIEKEKTRQKLVDETIKKFGRLDVLVNNAGLSHRSDLGDPNSLENLDYVMDVNVKSLMAMTRLCIPHLQKTKGNVVNISSIGSTWCVPSLTPYQLTKAAVDHYTRNASIEYAQVGVRVNAVRPGVITTNFGARHGSPSDQSLAWYENVRKNVIPMHRFGNPREVSNVIAFLASEKASYVTGSLIVVDGGLLAGPPLS